VPVNHQYVNINRRGDAGDPSEATGHIPLKVSREILIRDH